jgi:hypothetical protein
MKNNSVPVFVVLEECRNVKGASTVTKFKEDLIAHGGAEENIK